MTASLLRRVNKRSVIGIFLTLLLLLALIEAATGAALGICAGFAVLAFAVRGVTLSGALSGFVVALVLWLEGGVFFWALVIVFVLTWVATRIGRERKQQMLIAERPRGRDAVQVLANVGLAAALVILGRWIASPRISSYMAVAALAILAEAAADTVSSEIGKAFGGTPGLITTWKRVEIGTNGGITTVGSFGGICAAIIVSAATFLQWPPAALIFPIAAVAAIGGMFFDSVLGATLEGRWLNNDAVNFLSTCFAAACAGGLLWLTGHLH